MSYLSETGLTPAQNVESALPNMGVELKKLWNVIRIISCEMFLKKNYFKNAGPDHLALHLINESI